MLKCIQNKILSVFLMKDREEMYINHLPPQSVHRASQGLPDVFILWQFRVAAKCESSFQENVKNTIDALFTWKACARRSTL